MKELNFSHSHGSSDLKRDMLGVEDMDVSEQLEFGSAH